MASLIWKLSPSIHPNLEIQWIGVPPKNYLIFLNQSNSLSKMLQPLPAHPKNPPIPPRPPTPPTPRPPPPSPPPPPKPLTRPSMICMWVWPDGLYSVELLGKLLGKPPKKGLRFWKFNLLISLRRRLLALSLIKPRFSSIKYLNKDRSIKFPREGLYKVTITTAATRNSQHIISYLTQDQFSTKFLT